MEVPEDVKVGLQNIRPTLHARWNPAAKYLSGYSFDVNGNPRKVEFDPRWELWDTDAHGNEYKITTLEGPDGGFAPLGTWVLELMHTINPANYGGDLNRMAEELVDKPNAQIERLGEEAYENLLDFLADLCWSEHNRGSRSVLTHSLG